MLQLRVVFLKLYDAVDEAFFGLGQLLVHLRDCHDLRLQGGNRGDKLGQSVLDVRWVDLARRLELVYLLVQALVFLHEFHGDFLQVLHLLRVVDHWVMKASSSGCVYSRLWRRHQRNLQLVVVFLCLELPGLGVNLEVPQADLALQDSEFLLEDSDALYIFLIAREGRCFGIPEGELILDPVVCVVDGQVIILGLPVVHTRLWLVGRRVGNIDLCHLQVT